MSLVATCNEPTASDRINVLCIHRRGQEHLELIRQIDSRLVVWCSVDPMEFGRLLAEADVLLASLSFDIDFWQAPRLKWVHFLSAGVDWFFRCRHCEAVLRCDGEHFDGPSPCSHRGGHQPWRLLPAPEILVSTSSGAAAAPIAEHVFAITLAFTRRLPLLIHAQARHRWLKNTEIVPDELEGRTLGIVGMGNIGTRVAQLARAFGMRVLAVRRGAVAAEGPAAAPADGLYPLDRLDEVLAASDVVAVCVPLTADTVGFIDESRFRVMKPGALFVNVGRGRVVDEPALVRALRAGWIGGAALDVVAREPLDPASPLWEMPNVLITPHLAGVSLLYKRGVEAFCANLRSYLDDRPLANLLDRRRGY